MSNQFALIVAALILYYLLVLPWVAYATIQVRRRIVMEASGQPPQEIQRATDNMLSDFLEISLGWRILSKHRGIAVPAVAVGPVLIPIAASLVTVVVLFAVMWSTLSDATSHRQSA